MSTGVFSAWTSSASDSSNLKAATISLDKTTADSILDLLNLIPGDTLTRCIQVVNDGDAPVSLDVTPTKTDAEGLGAVLTVLIEEGTGASNVTNGTSCAGFVGAGSPTLPFGAAGLLSALSTSTPVNYSSFAAGAKKDFKVTVTMASNALSSLQGKAANFGLSFVATAVGGTR